MTEKTPLIGRLIFSQKRIIFRSEGVEYLVRRQSLRDAYFHNDKVEAILKHEKNHTSSELAEVRLIRRLNPSEHILTGQIRGHMIEVPRFLASRSHIPFKRFAGLRDGEWVLFFITKKRGKIIRRIDTKKHKDFEVSMLLDMQNIPQKWPKSIHESEKKLQKKSIFSETQTPIPSHLLIAHEADLSKNTLLNPHQTFATERSCDEEERIFFKNWYTLTIDGADARDLDDAISLAEYQNGDILLGVHIADVSYYVRDSDPIDHEARNRATSIYLPSGVIPMLGEILSNDLASLHPGEPKRTLTCLMRIDHQTGQVLSRDIFASMIESRKKGIYEEISADHENGKFQNPHDPYTHTGKLAFFLYDVLRKRRQKEGKILFSTTEPQFVFDKKGNIIDIRARSRNDAHKLIEECMVLANEEVAKWCSANEIPFLSRVHDVPPIEHHEILRQIMNLPHNTEIRAHHIATHLAGISEDSERYRTTRILLSKMSKAIYHHKNSPHFGLALEYYAHFTSPIRRYPDLVTHRMIRAFLTKNPEAYYTEKKLAHIATFSSEKERRAEGIEHTVTMMYACRYMKTQKSKIFSGKISGFTSWAIFVELENGIEVVVLLGSREHTIDAISGILFTKNHKKLYQIGESVSVEIERIAPIDYRILAKIV